LSFYVDLNIDYLAFYWCFMLVLSGFFWWLKWGDNHGLNWKSKGEQLCLISIKVGETLRRGCKRWMPAMSEERKFVIVFSGEKNQ